MERWVTAAFDALYDGWSAWAITPAIEAMLTIEPGAWSRITGMACLQPRNTPSTLIDITQRQRSNDMSTMSSRVATPALFTKTESPPMSALARATTSTQAASSATSCA